MSETLTVTNPPRKQIGLKLPPLKLLYFDGDSTQWIGFWELFKCSVHDQPGLTNVQKFTYMKGQFTGEALQLINGFAHEAASYLPSINLLQDTYGQEDRIKAAHSTNFCNLTSPQYESGS